MNLQESDNATYQVSGRCPVCGDEMAVTRLECRNCRSQLEGRFALGRFQRLNADQLRFVELFVQKRGKLVDVQRELDLSYPTVVARLNDVIHALGYEVESEEDGVAQSQAEAVATRRTILERIHRKEISADEGQRLLAGLR